MQQRKHSFHTASGIQYNSPQISMFPYFSSQYIKGPAQLPIPQALFFVDRSLFSLVRIQVPVPPGQTECLPSALSLSLPCRHKDYTFRQILKRFLHPVQPQMLRHHLQKVYVKNSAPLSATPQGWYYQAPFWLYPCIIRSCLPKTF